MTMKLLMKKCQFLPIELCSTWAHQAGFMYKDKIHLADLGTDLPDVHV